MIQKGESSMSSETPQLAASNLKIAAHGFSPTLNVKELSLTSRSATEIKKTLKMHLPKFIFCLLNREYSISENREVSLPISTLNLDKLEGSPSLDSQSTIQDQFQKF